MPEKTELLAWLNVLLSQWGALGGGAFALVCALLSRKVLALIGVVFAVCSYVFCMTGYRGVSMDQVQVASSVVSASVYARNKTPDRFYDSVLALNPDIIFWQEVPDVQKMLQRSQGSYFVAGQKQQGTLIFSRWPIESQRYIGNILLARVKGEAGKSLTLVSFHAPKFFVDIAGYNKFYRALLDELEHLKGESVIVGGDFNSTEFNYWRRVLRADGFGSALQDYGSGWLGTFPASGRPSLPGIPLVSIDDIYAGGLVLLRGEVLGESAGSDHYPVRLFFRWLPEGA